MASTLEQKTKAYWDVSFCWNGRSKGKPYTVLDAMKKLNSILSETSPRRPLAAHSGLLLEAIINKPDKKAASAT